MHCAFCNRTITPGFAWKVTSDRFYCSEFCADSEGAAQNPKAVLNPKAVPAETGINEPLAAPVHRKRLGPTLLDHHLSRPYERLEKLLPYMRQMSGRAAAGAQQRESSTRAA